MKQQLDLLVKLSTIYIFSIIEIIVQKETDKPTF